jgi:hypothetical protein
MLGSTIYFMPSGSRLQVTNFTVFDINETKLHVQAAAQLLTLSRTVKILCCKTAGLADLQYLLPAASHASDGTVCTSRVVLLVETRSQEDRHSPA